jgi:hypothetical protein
MKKIRLVSVDFDGEKLYQLEDAKVVDEPLENVDRRGYYIYNARATDVNGTLYEVVWESKDYDGNPVQDSNDVYWGRYQVQEIE